METIYRVTTEGDCEGKSIRLLAYATGDPTDIREYFDNEKMYAISTSEIKVVHISKESVINKNLLYQRKKEIEKELELINNNLKNK